jgi:hypothetical protein
MGPRKVELREVVGEFLKEKAKSHKIAQLLLSSRDPMPQREHLRCLGRPGRQPFGPEEDLKAAEEAVPPPGELREQHGNPHDDPRQP